jgi:hypothetical protein
MGRAAYAAGGVGADRVQEPQGARVPAAGAGQLPRGDDGDVDQRLRHQRGVPVRGVGRGRRRGRSPGHAHARRDAHLQPRQHVRYAPRADDWLPACLVLPCVSGALTTILICIFR